LTIPQLMHVLGVDPSVLGAADIAQMQRMKQRQMLDQVARLRGWLPVDLARLPLSELCAIIGTVSGKQPNPQHMAPAVAVYVDR
jgi:hypothetical protein